MLMLVFSVSVRFRHGVGSVPPIRCGEIEAEKMELYSGNMAQTTDGHNDRQPYTGCSICQNVFVSTV